MSVTSTNTMTLALGGAALLALLLGSGPDHRPPAGIRTAIELIANKPGRKSLQLGDSIACGPGWRMARAGPSSVRRVWGAFRVRRRQEPENRTHEAPALRIRDGRFVFQRGEGDAMRSAVARQINSFSRINQGLLAARLSERWQA